MAAETATAAASGWFAAAPSAAAVGLGNRSHGPALRSTLLPFPSCTPCFNSLRSSLSDLAVVPSFHPLFHIPCFTSPGCHIPCFMSPLSFPFSCSLFQVSCLLPPCLLHPCHCSRCVPLAVHTLGGGLREGNPTAEDLYFFAMNDTLQEALDLYGEPLPLCCHLHVFTVDVVVVAAVTVARAVAVVAAVAVVIDRHSDEGACPSTSHPAPLTQRRALGCSQWDVPVANRAEHHSDLADHVKTGLLRCASAAALGAEAVPFGCQVFGRCFLVVAGRRRRPNAVHPQAELCARL